MNVFARTTHFNKKMYEMGLMLHVAQDNPERGKVKGAGKGGNNQQREAIALMRGEFDDDTLLDPQCSLAVHEKKADL